MTDPLSRRRFLFTLAASVVAIGAPLPIGFPKDVTEIDLVWSACGSDISLEKWHMFQRMESTARIITGIDKFTVQLNTKLLTYNA